VKLLYFASAQGLANMKSEEVQLEEGSSVRDLAAKMLVLHPSLRSIEETVRYSVNFVIEGKETPLRDGDEVAVLPPIAGG